MPMRMTVSSHIEMNKLLQLCFNANAVIDNLAYNLDYNYYNEIAKIVHLSVAHVMPEWADIVSDKMLILSARPVRQGLEDHIEEINDLKGIFNTLLNTFNEIRVFVKELITKADMNDDDEVRIFAENFLDMINPFIKQAEEWVNAAEKLEPKELNIHIKEYTHFIDIK